MMSYYLREYVILATTITFNSLLLYEFSNCPYFSRIAIVLSISQRSCESIRTVQTATMTSEEYVSEAYLEQRIVF